MRTKPWREGMTDADRLTHHFGFYATQEDTERIMALAASSGQSISTTIRELVALGLEHIGEGE